LSRGDDDDDNDNNDDDDEADDANDNDLGSGRSSASRTAGRQRNCSTWAGSHTPGAYGRRAS
jgi:hypothetical protein